MRSLILLIVMSISLVVNAKGADKTGIYIVPTSPEFVQYSRFEVQILDSYAGDSTQVISYIFPEVLTGEPNRVLSLKRIPDTLNSWESDQLIAHCTTLGESFSCNISFKKEIQAYWNWHRFIIPFAHASSTALSKEKSIAHLSTMGFTLEAQSGLSHVIDEWFSNEPGGILIYDFK